MSPIATPKHKCTFAGCQFAFTKRNHLERHQKTHTQSQEFSCPTCQRRFSRLDSRNRHIQRVHTKQGGSVNAVRRQQSKPLHESTSLQAHSTRSDQSEQSRRHDDENREEEDDDEEDDDEDDDEDGDMTNINDGEQRFDTSNQRIISDGHGTDDAAYYGAAEQLSRLRHQPSASSESNRPHQGHFENNSDSNNNVMTMGDSTDMTSASFGLFSNIAAESPSNASIENSELLLDFDPMMTSLLWNTLEASITEASGPSYMTSAHRSAGGVGDHSAIFDLLTWQGKSPVLGRGRASAGGQQDPGDVFTPAGAGANQGRISVASASGYSRRAIIIPADQQQQQQYEGTSATALGPEAGQMASQMKSDLNSMMGHIEAPIEPEKGLASSCFWLCRRHFLPTSVLTAPQRMSKVQDDGYALVMNLIAIGSLWHHNKVVRKWGTDIWSFTLRIVWSRGMRNVQDDATVSMLMSILLSGHSYVLRSSDPTVHSLGRRAWLFCHLLHDNITHRSLKHAGSDAGGGVEEDLELFLNQATYRVELRNNAPLLHQSWNRWKQMERGIRVAWGIRIYDSQQAAWLDMIPALQADVSQKYPEPASEKILEAKTAQDWLNKYEADIPKRRDLVSVMKLLHRPFPCSSQKIEWSSSQQADYNIIESIYSSWLLDNTTLGKTSEYWNMAAQRLPQELGLLRSAHALANWRLYRGVAIKERHREDTYCLLIRWHCVHLNFGLRDVDLVDYVREQTRHLSNKESEAVEAKEALQVPRKQSQCTTTAEEFYCSARGRRTLWHAGHISAELSRLPRVTSTPLHVAQAAYESTLVLVAFALIANQRQDSRQGRAFELLSGGQHEEDDDDQSWIQLGLAGFLTSDTELYTVDSSAHTDWGNSDNSAARRWILEGETQDTTISSLSIQQCSMALQDVNRALEQSRLLWCLAADYQQLITRGLSML
jgi:hypothetical protein